MTSADGSAFQSVKSMERLFIEPKHQPLFAAVGWNSFASISGHFLEGEPKGHGAVIVRREKIEHGGQSLEVFFKQYEFRNASWAFLWRASKARREFENYGAFARLGVAAAERDHAVELPALAQTRMRRRQVRNVVTKTSDKPMATVEIGIGPLAIGPKTVVRLGRVRYVVLAVGGIID